MTYFADVCKQPRFSADEVVHSTERSSSYRLSEDAQAYVLALDLPGVTAESLDIQIDQGILRIQAQRESLQPDGFKQIYGEFKPRQFDYQFSLGDHVAVDEIQATFVQGVLSLRLAKRPEASPRKIAVTAA